MSANPKWRGRRAARCSAAHPQPVPAKPGLRFSYKCSFFKLGSTGMRRPEEATPRRRGWDGAASLLNKTSAPLNPPLSPQ